MAKTNERLGRLARVAWIDRGQQAAERNCSGNRIFVSSLHTARPFECVARLAELNGPPPHR